MVSRRALTGGLLGLALGLPLIACGRKAANLPPRCSRYPRIYPEPRIKTEPEDCPPDS